jgi:hypothetical protein
MVLRLAINYEYLTISPALLRKHASSLPAARRGSSAPAAISSPQKSLSYFFRPRYDSRARPCLTADEAGRLLNKDVCVSAHVYDVVQLPDGTRFLDVCPPATPDLQCRFTIISLWEDREEVGALEKYRNTDVRVRGIVRPLHGRSGILLSHARQFYGGPPRFRPNPLLVRGFTAEQDKPPVEDPNLRAQGGRRAFMNTRDQERMPIR